MIFKGLVIKGIYGREMYETSVWVLAENYDDLTYRLFVGGVMCHEQVVTDNKPFRMPSGYAGRVVQIEVEGTSPARQMQAAQSVSELV